MSEKLERCPFCGCQGWLHTHGGIFQNPPSEGHRVECEGSCHAMTCYWHTKAEAIENWNRRVPPPPDRGMAGALAKELKRLIQYGRWQISEESPGWHPTLPSAVGAAAETLAQYEASTASQPQPERRAMAGAETLPDDVVALVCAARCVAFEDQGPDAIKALDTASEAFSSRVPWDDEPEDA